jgi:putative membrane protein
MMKRLAAKTAIASLIVVGLGLGAHTSWADGEHGKPLEAVLEEIRESQGVGVKEGIDGEAFMSAMHPDPREHALMDRMMGGEDSPMLAVMHRVMGARYLGCYTGGTVEGMMGIGAMGGGMMGPGMMGGVHPRGWAAHYGMMADGYGAWPFWLLLLIILGIAIYLAVRAGTARVHPAETPLEILRKRYARGEITKDDFESMKRDLM